MSPFHATLCWCWRYLPASQKGEGDYDDGAYAPFIYWGKFGGIAQYRLIPGENVKADNYREPYAPSVHRRAQRAYRTGGRVMTRTAGEIARVPYESVEKSSFVVGYSSILCIANDILIVFCITLSKWVGHTDNFVIVERCDPVEYRQRISGLQMAAGITMYCDLMHEVIFQRIVWGIKFITDSKRGNIMDIFFGLLTNCI